jgi:hypothetical protein
MPHIFTHAEYADMMYVYGFCDGSATAAVKEYSRRFSNCRISNSVMFAKVFNTLRGSGTLPSSQGLSECERQQYVDEVENILQLMEPSPTT